MDSEPRTIAVLRFRVIAAPTAESWLASDVLPVERLDEILGWLYQRRWPVLTAAELVAGLEDPETLPERATLITFDGASRTVLDEALGVLRRYRFPAVAFVPTGFVGEQVTLDGLDDPMTVCTWEELRQLERHEVSVQSMGVGRRRLSRLDPAQQEREAADSRDAIRVHVGRPADFFAYPHGDLGRDPEVTMKVVRLSGYRAAFALGGGLNELPGANPYRLARIRVAADTDLSRELGE
jgi:peptidoglycan/xylan/chitin deacetylase (PgdA/CDA1 family)